MIVLPRETSEFLVPSMTVDGQTISDFEVAVCARGVRPADGSWTANPGPKISNMPRGLYKVYGRCTRNGQTYVRRLDAATDDAPAQLQLT